jgi:glucoamylase
VAETAIWSLNAPVGRIAAGVALVIALPRAAILHWGIDGWQNVSDRQTGDIGLGLHGCTIGPQELARATCINFTFRWTDTQIWAGNDFQIAIDG